MSELDDLLKKHRKAIIAREEQTFREMLAAYEEIELELKAFENNDNETIMNNRQGKTPIIINQSATADTRSCDFSSVSKNQLLKSSEMHIEDVKQGMGFFISEMMRAAERHDWDKFCMLDHFHSDFASGFEKTEWWDNHRKVNRHHLMQEDGVPEDVNLVDVMEFIVDCVMAGMARSGDVYPLALDIKVLERAFNNTVEMLKERIVVRK